VKLFGGVALDKMSEVIVNADLGVVPKRADSFGNEAYSTKIMEFMSQGVPVVVSRTKVDTYYFQEGDVHFFPSGDSQAMAQAMLDVVNNLDLRESLITHGYEYVEQNSWGRRKKEYLDLVDSLSIERFVGLHPALASTSILHSTRSIQQSEDPADQVGALAGELDDHPSASTLKKN
jgi:glycosyltransferase involved in cell wall biosynthesis